MDMTGRIADCSLDFVSGKIKLTIEVNERQTAELCYDELHNEETLQIKIGKFRKKRSLDANGYFWALCDKLAGKTGIAKTEIYRNYIKEIGGNSDTVCVLNSAVGKLCEMWERNGLGWLTETFSSKLEGCTNVTLYYGSSTYDTAQMKRLIDNVIQDCEEQGIDTKTPDEIADMLSLWEQEEERG